MIHQHARGDAIHPHALHGNELTDPVNAVIADRQGLADAAEIRDEIGGRHESTLHAVVRGVNASKSSAQRAWRAKNNARGRPREKLSMRISSEPHAELVEG